MSLVHRSWTSPAQRVLRRNVKLHSYDQLHKFSKENMAGPHVRGLSYVYTPYSGLGGYDIAPSTHWKLLADTLSRCPNIRQLSVKSLYRFLSKETEYKNFCRDRNTNDIDLVYSSIKDLVNLEALVFDVDLRFVQTSRLLLDFYSILPDLRNLQYLQAIVWRIDFGNDDEDDIELITSIPDRSPPPSLKKLALHLVSPFTPVPLLKWLLRPSGEYHLEELIIDRPEWHQGKEMELRAQLHGSDSFASAQRVRFIDYAETNEYVRPNKAFITPIVNLLSSVRDLELYWDYSERLVELPRLTTRIPIENLTVCIASYGYYAARTADKELFPWIERQSFPNLRRFRVRRLCPYSSEESPSEDRFPLITEACKNAKISLELDFEARRIEDLYESVYVP
ncbi:hypothetical protein SCHPADRAFT_1712 [Schizopora paradoxa]|uniref:F-box domain-containing protein n=1 Tax=Schizopora paradoxa TaxID=27342 RepID=A0A0H2SF27_9AGAM|nr:hypothetical protein SCHPADRAFT_1712 [Schizopora paradoxa]